MSSGRLKMQAFRKLGALLRDGSFARQVSVVLTGSTGAQAVTFIGSLLLARVFAPVEFGVFGLYASVAAVLAIVSTLRFEQAIPIAAEEDAKPTLILSIVAVLATSSLTGLGVLLWGEQVLQLLHVSELGPLLPFLAIGMLISGLHQAVSHWSIRVRAFGALSRSKLIMSTGTTGLQLFLGMFSARAIGLVGGSLLGRLTSLTLLAVQLQVKTLMTLSLRDVKRLANRYRSFPLFGGPSTLIRTLGVQSPVLVLAAFHEPAVVGLFSLCQRTVTAVVELVAGSVKQVFLSRIAALSSRSVERLRLQGVRLAGALFLIGLPFAGFIFIMGPSLFSLLFGSQWLQAGEYARLLAPMLLIQFAVIPVAQLDAMEQQFVHLIWSILRLALIGAGYGLAVYNFEASPAAIIASYSISNSVSLLLLAGLWFAVTKDRKSS